MPTSPRDARNTPTSAGSPAAGPGQHRQSSRRPARAGTACALAALAFAVSALAAGNAPTILSQPKGGSAAAGGYFCFDVLPDGAKPFGYQWHFRGSAFSGNTNTQRLADGTGVLLVRTDLRAAHDGAYWVVVTNAHGSVTSAVATLRVSDPVILADPGGGSAVGGRTFKLGVYAAGTEPLAYQWLTNNVAIPGATNSELTLNPVTKSHARTYTVRVSNAFGTNTSAGATLTVSDPVITNQPQSLAVDLGTNVILSVGAEGNPPLRYQWSFKNALLTNQTASQLFLPSVTLTQAGTYFVTVTNAGGTARSTNVTLTVHGLDILAQPRPGTNDFRETWTNAVVARGRQPLRYQWFFQGVAAGAPTNLLASQTNAALVMMSLTGTNRGFYWARVTNAVGVTNSARAELKVNDPLLLQGPVAAALSVGESTNLTAQAHGSGPLRYQWFFNGATLTNATNAVLPLSNVTTSRAGLYGVRVTNHFGAVRSADVNVTVYDLAILKQPVSGFVVGGRSFTNSVEARGAAPLRYQWHRRGQLLPGKTDPVLVIANATTNDSGAYHVVVSNALRSLASAHPTLAVLDPVIGRQPQGGSALVGGSFAFTTEAGGNPPFAYQWYFNGAALAGATRTSLALTGLSATQAGPYTVKISNAAGSLMSSTATLAVASLAIVEQPQGGTAVAGSNFTFRVVAAGTGPLTYQWLKGGATLTNATQPALTLTNVTGSQAGNYSVRVSNGATNLTSATATLTVDDPAILVQPQGGYATLGEDFSMETLAVGDEPILYQWYLNGAALPGRLSPVLDLAEVTSSQGGTYYVIARNAHGSRQSANAVLAVSSGYVRRLFTGEYVAGALELGLVGTGREHALTFSMSYDPVALGTPVFVPPADGPAANATVTLTNDPAGGLVGVTLELPPGVTFARTNWQRIGQLVFDVDALGVFNGRLDFTNVPLAVTASDVNDKRLWLTTELRPSLTVLDDEPFLDPQTGLLRQRLFLSNPTAYPSSNALVAVYGMGVDSRTNPIVLYNAQRQDVTDPDRDALAGTPTYSVQAALDRGGFQRLTLEFYAADQNPAFPIGYAAAFGNLALSTPSNLAAGPTPTCACANGELLLEFPTAAGRTYYIQYAASLEGPWRTVFPAVLGTGSRVQWIDLGPPQTTSAPYDCGVRFYRIMLVP